MSRPNERGRLRPGAVPVRPGEPWITGRVYQWNGVQWFMIPPPTESNRQNADLYLTATSDATEGAPAAIFSFAQIRSLVASSIFANLVGAKNIIVNSGGSMQSEDYVPGQRGFIIRANGTAEFNNATFRGHVEADSGRFRNGEFEGGLVSGDTWDENGNVINPNSWGGILSHRRPNGEGQAVRINRLNVFNDAFLGGNINGQSPSPHLVRFAGQRRILHGSALESREFSRNNILVSTLRDWLQEQFPRINTDQTYPIIGMIRLRSQPIVSVHVHSLCRIQGVDNNTFRLLGMNNADGGSVMVWIQATGNFVNVSARRNSFNGDMEATGGQLASAGTVDANLVII